MRSLPEQELLRLARCFDQGALTELYDRHSNGLYYYALRLLGDPLLAEDCAAETFTRLLRALRNGGGPTENLKAYLYRAAHNWIADHYRRTPPVPLEDGIHILRADEDPADQAEANLTQARVRRALRLLTSEQQQVVALRFIEGWELVEIAECLQKPVGAVKALQHRALAALQRLLRDQESREHATQP
ncbi:MAG TPA: sigma-70 family RNA polymerase sigma factor [Anaerolineales bacterium]|nr:sigma-70 family RNA polymerase sigma factor [Anaerolineales bacterium]